MNEAFTRTASCPTSWRSRASELSSPEKGNDRAGLMHLQRRKMDHRRPFPKASVSCRRSCSARESRDDVTEFFAAGRAAPWWLIGISLVATTFSTDTPNLVTNLIRDGGVSENWLWWAFLLTGMATVFFYARLWRRSGVLTDLEFSELDTWGGAPRSCAAFAQYISGFFQCCIMTTRQLGFGEDRRRPLRLAERGTLAICVVIPIVFASRPGL